MSDYKAKFFQAKEFGTVYAFIIRIDYDGQENVIHGYAGRHFKTQKAAERSTGNYITKHCQ